MLTTMYYKVECTKQKHTKYCIIIKIFYEETKHMMQKIINTFEKENQNIKNNCKT